MTVVDAFFSGYLKQNSTDDPVQPSPSITVTFQSMSISSHCFPYDYIDQFLDIITDQFTQGLHMQASDRINT